MNSETETLRSTVVRAWRETLEAEPASDDEDFFEAGGNSILVVQLQRRLAKALGHPVPLRQIHDHPTVGGLLGLGASLRPSDEPEADGRAPGLTLYCLPYAGASARMYDHWKDRLPASVKVVPLELPGRGSRWSEPALTELSPLLDDLTGAMDEARHTPYAVLGHSFGGVLAFELVRHLADQGFPAPQRLLVSACLAPHEATPTETNYDLSDAEFIESLRKVRGTPEELLENEELMELYIPTIRADYTILDLYEAPSFSPLEYPISVFYGVADQDAARESMDAWEKYSSTSVVIEGISGDHFFLRDSEDEFLTKLSLHLGAGPAAEKQIQP
ncbi:alpha/beta fold hydrolase [Streptomyces sp. NPDC005900]|uniref:alpha/beta fold hydrolase n=1 Tax=Streptomyces sp. NPDC005900 TaxID=3154569 RepID=UPI0033EB5630